MKFEQMDYLFYFLLIPGIFLLIGFYHRHQIHQIRQAFDPSNVKKLAEKLGTPFNGLRLTLWVLAMVLIITAIMGPLLGERIREIKQEGVDVIIALDVSNSMNAEDVAPSRFEKAKLEIRNFVNQLKGDRVGLIVFEYDAFLQCPLTTDYSAINLYLDALTTGYLPNPGTNLAAPLEVAANAFNRTLSIEQAADPDADRNRVLVIISDGEDHEGTLETVVTSMKESNIKVFTVGIGTPQGAPIPEKTRYGQTAGYKRNARGEVVTSKLSEKGLAQLAQQADGAYFRVGPNYSEFYKLKEELDKLTRADYQAKEVVDLDNKFQYPLAAALVLLVVEMALIPNYRRQMKRKHAV